MDCLIKKSVFLFLSTLFSVGLLAQEKYLVAEETQYTYGFINIAGDVGVHQIHDEYLKCIHNSRNAFQWNVGLELGNTASDFLVFMQFGRYSLNTDLLEDELDSLGVPNGNTNKINYNTRRNRIAVGITRTERLSKRSALTISSAMTYSTFIENSREIEASSPGVLLGMGYLYNGIDNVNYFVRINYEYGRFSSNGISSDMSGLNLVTGISITIDRAE